eukprot:1322072-Alexandrium_andersonii.AAC.1
MTPCSRPPPLGSPAAAAFGPGDPAPWPCRLSEAWGPEGFPDRCTQGALARVRRGGCVRGTPARSRAARYVR